MPGLFKIEMKGNIMADKKIIPMFPTDEDLLSWVRGQLWVLKNSQNTSNDMVTLPAGRVAFAMQRLEELLNPLVMPPSTEPEYEPRGPRGEKSPVARQKAGEISPRPGDKVAVKGVKGLADGVYTVGLKDNEKRVLEAIKKTLKAGDVPTYRGIAADIGAKSHNGVHIIVNRLAEYGLVQLIGEGKNKRIGLPSAA